MSPDQHVCDFAPGCCPPWWRRCRCGHQSLQPTAQQGSWGTTGCRSTTDYWWAAHTKPRHYQHNSHIIIFQVLKDPWKTQGIFYPQLRAVVTSAVLGFQHRILLSFPQLSKSSGSAKLQAIARTPLFINGSIKHYITCHRMYRNIRPFEK